MFSHVRNVHFTRSLTFLTNFIAVLFKINIRLLIDCNCSLPLFSLNALSRKLLTCCLYITVMSFFQGGTGHRRGKEV